MRTRSRWPLSLKMTNADRQIPPSGISRVCSGRSVGAKRLNLRSVGMPNEPHAALFNLAADRHSRFQRTRLDRKSTRLNSSHLGISYAVFCLKKKKKKRN